VETYPDEDCETRSDAEGRFRVPGLTPGTYRLWWSKDGWLRDGEPPVVPTGARDVILRLARPGTVSGRVLLRGTDRPALRFRLLAVGAERAPAERRFERADGSFAVALLPGRYELEARAGGDLISPRVVARVTAGAETTVELVLGAARAIRVWTTDAGGEPVPCLAILLATDGRVIRDASAPVKFLGPPFRWTATGVGGPDLGIRPVAPGSYRVRVVRIPEEMDGGRPEGPSAFVRTFRRLLEKGDAEADVTVVPDRDAEVTIVVGG
jgi:hypothetical protein